VGFSNLPREVVRLIVDKFVIELEVQLSDRNVTISLSDEARDWLALRGYDENFGARPLSRVIQEHIKKPLADEVLFGRLLKGGSVNVVVEKTDGVSGLGFTFESLPDRPSRSRKKPPRKPKGKPPPDGKTVAKSAGRKKASSKKPKGGGSTSTVPKVPLSVD
ncbi:MAG: ATP-dependent Clp protease ATP-binding subunit ClpA, partial [Hyphomicrobiales bacterium]